MIVYYSFSKTEMLCKRWTRHLICWTKCTLPFQFRASRSLESCCGRHVRALPPDMSRRLIGWRCVDVCLHVTVAYNCSSSSLTDDGGLLRLGPAASIRRTHPRSWAGACWCRTRPRRGNQTRPMPCSCAPVISMWYQRAVVPHQPLSTEAQEPCTFR